MREWDLKITSLLQKIIENEKSINSDLKELYISFTVQKTSFPFGKLCILHYNEFKKTECLDEEIYLIASAIELIILAFDIVDDIQDQDSVYIWMENQAQSLNVVLMILILASKIIRKSKFEHREQVMKLIESYIIKSINGQYLDLINHGIDEQSYLEMIKQKSGALTALSIMVGTILATGKNSPEIEKYSVSLGVIQQIKNDIQGLKDWKNKNDLLNKKYSLPIIYLLETDPEDSLKLKSYFEGQTDKINVNTVKKALLKSGAIQYALTLKNIIKNDAIESIELLSLSEKTKKNLYNLMK